MIEFLHIENFQSHKETDLVFDPGVNVIVGTTDSGKSAIIRSLRWLTWNRPSGDSFRSSWGGPTVVQAGIEDEKILCRQKDKIEEYILAKPGKKDTVFKAFGTDVPKEISEQLNLSDINLQLQMDKPFLLSSSPGEVASYFNKIARLDKIDVATSNVNKWIRELTSDIKYKTEDVKSLTVKKADFEYLEKMEMEIEVLEDLENRLSSKKSKSKQFIDLLNDILQTSVEIEESSPLIKLEESVNNVLDLLETKQTTIAKHNNLIDLLTLINEADAALDEYTFQISLEKKVDTIISLIEKKSSNTTSFVALTDSLETINDMIDLLNKELDHLSDIEETFHKEFPNQCPLCGTIIKK